MEPDWKGLESRGREKPPCSWAVPAAALREAEPSWLTPLRVSREEGGSGGLLCSGVGALLGTSYQSLVVEKLEISPMTTRHIAKKDFCEESCTGAGL